MPWPQIRVVWKHEKEFQDVVKFDLRGDRRMVFARDHLTYQTEEIYAPLPIVFVTNEPLAYKDIEWIGSVRKRQWWALIMAVLIGSLGILWMVKGLGEGKWDEFTVGLIWFLLWGALPLWIFCRGRPFLIIASPFAAIAIPMDRKTRQIRKVLTLLRSFCPDSVRWEIPIPVDASK